MMKKKLALMLAVIMAASVALTACGSGSEGADTNAGTATEATDTAETTAAETTAAETTAAETTSTGDKQLAVQLGPDPETIDPALNSAVDGGNMILHSFECLMTIDQEGKVAPGQAESYEVSEDGLTWTFHLREGLKWSDGSALTANDFVYSWKRVCDPEVAAPYAETVLGMVEGFAEATDGNLDALQVSAPDDLTFVVQLAQPCTYFDSLAAFATLSPVQQATIEANGDAWATTAETYVSNGTFHVTEWVPGSHIIMSKNPNHWNADAITLGSIKFVLMEDSNAVYSAYQTGEILLAKQIPTEEIPSLEGNPEFYIDPIIGTYYISLNNKVEPFTDPLVRKALSLSIDREYVAGTLMQGTYTAAPNMMGPGWTDADGSAFMDKANGGAPYIDTTNFEANLEEAKKLMEEAGFPGGEGFPTITYSTNDAGYHKVVAEYLQQAWAELGITLNVEVVEWSSFTPLRRAGDYEISRNGWVGDYSDASNQLDLFYSTNGNNDGKFSNADFDAAMDTARSTTDIEERSAALHKAEDIIMAETACIPVAYYNDFWLQSEKLTGTWHSPYGYWHLMYADITE